jgi:hypothetical protein
MQGVITAIVAFIFVCIIFPSLIKNRAQYYAALALVLAAIFLDAVASVSGTGFRGLIAVLGALLVIGAIGLLILSSGGLAMRDLAGDIGKTIEVVRRGGEKETIIVPLSERPVPADQKVYVPRPRSADSSSAIPMDE